MPNLISAHCSTARSAKVSQLAAGRNQNNAVQTETPVVLDWLALQAQVDCHQQEAFTVSHSLSTRRARTLPYHTYEAPARRRIVNILWAQAREMRSGSDLTYLA